MVLSTIKNSLHKRRPAKEQDLKPTESSSSEPDQSRRGACHGDAETIPEPKRGDAAREGNGRRRASSGAEEIDDDGDTSGQAKGRREQIAKDEMDLVITARQMSASQTGTSFRGFSDGQGESGFEGDSAHTPIGGGAGHRTLSNGNLNQNHPELADEEVVTHALKMSRLSQWSFMSYLEEELGPQDDGLGDRSNARRDEKLIYNTVFKVPYEVERVLSLGSLLGVDAVLSALTLLPLKSAICIWELLAPPREGKGATSRSVTADDLSNGTWLATLIVVSYALTRIDVSFIYHYIRSQDTIKLYVVFNILDIMDKLFLSFNTDTFEAMALRAYTCTDKNLTLKSRIVEAALLFRNWLISTTSILVHGSVILIQAVTLNVALNTSNKGLLPLLVSNQFMEVKGFVFKRMDYKRLFNITCQDIAERVNIIVMVLFVVIHSALAAMGKKNAALVSTALYQKLLVVSLGEFVVDWMKHAFLSKFNSLPSTTYRRFLSDISKSRRTTASLYSNKVISFVPLAHAAVCVRLLSSIHRAFPFRVYALHWILGSLMVLVVKVLFGLCIKVGYPFPFVCVCATNRALRMR